jgi:hypothetical protein
MLTSAKRLGIFFKQSSTVIRATPHLHSICL